MDTYKDSRGRAVSAEEIALRWIAQNPESARRAVSGRAAPPAPRPFGIHAKDAGATPDGRGRVTLAPVQDEEITT